MDEEIRPATPADAAALGRMHWTAWQEAYSGLLPAEYWTPEAEAARIEGWRRDLTNADGTVTVRIAIRGGSVIGVAAAGPARIDAGVPPVRDRGLWVLYLLATEYGSGLASRLLETVLPPGTPAELWVFEANPRARAFYAKHAFTPDGARHVFGPELGDQAEIRLVR